MTSNSIPFWEQLFGGFDPGATKGALAFITAQMDVVALLYLPSVKKTLTTKTKSGNNKTQSRSDEQGLQRQVQRISKCADSVFVLIEDVGPLRFAKAAAGLSDSHACIRSACAWAGFSYSFVIPRIWQKTFFNPPRKEEDTKKLAIQIARRLFPKVAHLIGDNDDGLADALLLAELCRRQTLGLNLPPLVRSRSNVSSRTSRNKGNHDRRNRRGSRASVSRSGK